MNRRFITLDQLKSVASALLAKINQKPDTSSLSDVSFTGDYNDLSNRPDFSNFVNQTTLQNSYSAAMQEVEDNCMVIGRDEEVFVAEYGVTSDTDIVAAYEAGKVVTVQKDGIVYTLAKVETVSGTTMTAFTAIVGSTLYTLGTAAGQWNTASAVLAPLASPAFTGTPTAPTPTSSSGATQVATKGYVDNAGGVFVITVTESSGTLSADKTFAEITAAVTAGKVAVVVNGTKHYQIRSITASNIFFKSVGSGSIESLSVSSADVWTYDETVYGKIFIAAYGTETFANIRAAHVAGKIVFTINDSKVFRLIYCTTTSIVFVRNTGSPSVEVVTVSTADVWTAEYQNAQGQITASGILKGDGAGGVTAAVAGTDYAAASHNHSASNITSGTLGVARGGTGAASFTSGALLKGNGSNAITTATAGTDYAKPIAKVWTGTCSTAVGTAAKVVTLDDSTGFSLTNGVKILITFVNGNTATTPTLNVASTGAKIIGYCDGITNKATSSAATSIGATESVVFTYYSNMWVLGPSGYGTKHILDLALGRETVVSNADTNYTSYIARGEALNSADTNPTVNGAISWTYS